MAPTRRILLASPKLEEIRALTRMLRQKGFHVHYAPDGSKALELTVLRHPDLIVFDDACLLLEAKTFLQIVRANPRSQGIPIVFLAEPNNATLSKVAQDAVLNKPWTPMEAWNAIDKALRHSTAVEDRQEQARQVEGQLSQLGLADLLQVLASNRRSGRLQVTDGAKSAEIHIKEGQPVAASLGNIHGEKAFVRLLNWREGSFVLNPSSSEVEEQMFRPMEEALLEGLRLHDELERMLPELPPPQQVIALSESLTQFDLEQHPVTAEVIQRLQKPRSVAELFDVVPYPDADVAGALLSLLQHGLVYALDTQQKEEGPLLDSARTHALRSLIFRHTPARKTTISKVILISAEAGQLAHELQSMASMLTSVNTSETWAANFGTVGRLTIDRATFVDLVILPSNEASHPLWLPFGQGALGAIILDTHKSSTLLARHLYGIAPMPLMVLGHEVPAELRRLSESVVPVSGSCLEAIKALLHLLSDTHESARAANAKGA